MADLEIIKKIEEIFGFELKRVEQKQVKAKDFFTVNPFSYSLRERESPQFPYKGARNYCLDENGFVTGLSLDYCPVFLLEKACIKIDFLNEIKFISLRKFGPGDYSFLKELKSLSSLDLSNNQITDISFFAGFKQ
ncbi:MAG: hypothetical protein PVH88_18415 [Ignavibacteria bacterium]|jgi:hypothetical protein